MTNSAMPRLKAERAEAALAVLISAALISATFLETYSAISLAEVPAEAVQAMHPQKERIFVPAFISPLKKRYSAPRRP